MSDMKENLELLSRSLYRLPVAELADEQLHAVVARAVLLHQAVQHAVNAVGQLGGVVVVGQAIHHGFQLQIVRLTVTKRRDLGPEGVQRERLAVQARAGQAV